MKKYISRILIGFAVTLTGCVAGILYITDAYPDKSIIMLTLSISFLVIGLYILGRTILNESFYSLTATDKENMQTGDTRSSENNGFINVLKKNNELMAEYDKFFKMRDKMKVLKIAGEAEEKSKNMQ